MIISTIAEIIKTAISPPTTLTLINDRDECVNTDNHNGNNNSNKNRYGGGTNMNDDNKESHKSIS